MYIPEVIINLERVLVWASQFVDKMYYSEAKRVVEEVVSRHWMTELMLGAGRVEELIGIVAECELTPKISP